MNKINEIKIVTWKWFVGASLGSLMILTTFQNCASPPPENNGESAQQTIADAMQFEYDTTLDQVAYMSCSNIPNGTYDKTTYFTFKTGAYYNAGIKLQSDFFNQVGQRPLAEQQQILQTSPANSNTQLQLAVRNVGSPQELMTSTGAPVDGEDFVEMFDPLGTDQMSTYMTQFSQGTRFKRVPTGTPQGSRVEGSLYFTSSYATLLQVLNFITDSGGILAQTYTFGANGTGGSPTEAMTVADVASVTTQTGSNSNNLTNYAAYGRGIHLAFGPPDVSPLFGNYPQQTVLTAASDINLVNPSDTSENGTWFCPTQLQFRIVRQADLGQAGANCVKQPDPANPDAYFSIARQQLHVEDWYIDEADQCIIAKNKTGPDCYGTFPSVVYTMGDSCSTTPPVGGGAPQPGACVSYFSVCYRTN